MSDWTPMRGELVESPKLRKMADAMKPEIQEIIRLDDGDVAPILLRYLMAGALARLWTKAGQFGTFEGADLVLTGYTVDDVDELVGLGGFGGAMIQVGWLKACNGAVRLPRFREHGDAVAVASPPPKKRSPKKSSEAAVAAPSQRPRDDLFDAIAALTASDPELCGGQIAKVAHALRKQATPVTPEEVRQFGDRFAEICPWAKDDGRTIPTIGEVGKYVLRVRVKRTAKAAPEWVPPSERA